MFLGGQDQADGGKVAQFQKKNEFILFEEEDFAVLDVFVQFLENDIEEGATLLI